MNDKIVRKHANRLLVVEDDPTISGMLGKVLMEEGYDVSVCDDGDKALQLLNTTSFDLALLDLHVPHRSGFDLLREIRQKNSDSGAFVPVIVLTGVYTSRNDKITSLDAGADDFLAKPFDLIELLARVRSLIRVQELYKRSQFLATHDQLTRCYNRHYLMEFLEREFQRFKRYKTPMSFLLLDLDHFKQINDQHGHEAGDKVLMHVGFKLQDFFRAVDCVARLGGDEFAAVLPDCDADEAKKVGERLLRFINDSNSKKELPEKLANLIGFSIGMACVPEHTEDPEELVRMADEAMYNAKKAGRNGFRLAA